MHLTIVLSLLVGACASPVDHRPRGRAPDAVLVTKAPHGGALDLQVIKPTVWSDDTGSVVVDPRMTLALVDETHALWRASARMDTLEALAFAADLSEAASQTDQGASLVTLAMSPGSAQIQSDGLCRIDGGRWRVLGAAGRVVQLGLVDDAGGCLLTVEIDRPTAEFLHRQVAMQARTSN